MDTTLHWSSDLHDVDWRELSALYRVAPLGDKDPDLLKVAFHGSRFRWFARQQGRLVGVGRVLADGCDVAYVCDVAVHPDLQGTGLGRELMDRLLAPCEGYPKILLYAKPGVEPFYRRLGFRRMATAMARFANEPLALERGYLHGD
ncbi:GNAT family N-acetyltransferase [Ramlibacter humi]|uniref:GNAT family N-acetyltransferase n=1 Tax=Ramlibacter humi TaxID=2530451 RepID=A0A4Z0CC09_9BURK|nr:GNAT family N-acetyltransferase [Ramlibacter humi]TFZ07599.1 GNAT family N-acetyltransferase [Ramlibacter humi]